MIRWSVLVLGGLVALTLVALALGGRQPRADFVVASEELRTIDPQRVSYADELQVAAALFEGLTRRNPLTLRAEPGVAERWETDAHGRVVTFRLRPAARWADGAPVVAEDFRRAWLSALEPGSGAQYASLLFVIDGAQEYFRARGAGEPAGAGAAARVGIEARDESTLAVRLVAPCPYFLELVAMPVFAPRRESAASHPGDSPSPGQAARIGNGAFTLDRWEFKRRLLLRRNPLYWDAAAIGLETIEIFMTSDPNLALLAYESGRIDLVRTILPETARLLAARGRRDFHSGERFATFFLRLNCTRAPLDEPAIRQALALAIDKQSICRSLLSLGEQPADGYVPTGAIPLMRATDARGAPVEYSPPPGLGAGSTPARRAALARELLAHDGRMDRLRARPLELSFSADPPLQALVCEAVQAMWRRELGLEVVPRRLERKVLSEQIRRLDYDVVRSDWYGDYLDPATFLDMFTSDNGQNRTGWRSADYDRLIATAALEADPARRFAMLARAEQVLIADELPIIPIYFRRGAILLRDSFIGLVDNPLEILPIHRAARR